IRNAREIGTEVDQIVIRFMVATIRYGTQENAGPPRLGPIIGSKLLSLIFRETNSAADLDAALKKEGLPSLAQVTADETPNVQRPGN
ncbi:MAG TPA: hypothetical protein VN817_05140, partial [Solirubrobacteraceae bacterium]|nr:hypothetical protein [Solirubrobacteraceae bacterium]